MEDSRYIICKPTQHTHEPTQTIEIASKRELHEMLACHDQGERLALDLETRGLYPCYHRDWVDTLTPKGNKKKRPPMYGQSIFAVGMHSASLGSVCVWLPDSYKECLADLITWLVNSRAKLTNHNDYFDWMALGAFCGAGKDPLLPLGKDEYEQRWLQLNWVYDSYIMFKMLATEGWYLQSHGLKTGQVDLLGWDERGDAALGEWLKAHKLTKGDMHLAPKAMVGHYCALDAQSAWHLANVLEASAAPFPACQIVMDLLMREARMLLVNYFVGIPVDIEGMRKFKALQVPNIESLMREFMADPRVARIMEADWEAFLKDHPPPNEHKKVALPKEPKGPRITKAGHPSQAWLKYDAKMALVEPPVETLQFARYKAKAARWAQEWERYGVPLDLFILDSSTQLARLMYSAQDQGGLGFEVKAFSKQTRKAQEQGKPPNPSVGKDAFGGWGNLGQILRKRSKAVKLAASVDSWLSNTDPGAGLLHPLFRVPGTTTLRLSGSGGVNCLHESMELLTRHGWVGVKGYVDGEDVWQVTEQGAGSWCKGRKVVGSTNTWLELQARNGSTWKVTPDHRMLSFDYKGRPRVTRADELPSDARHLFCSTSDEQGDDYSDVDIWKAAAIQADGTLRKSRATKGGYTGCYYIGVRKPRKIAKLRELFDQVVVAAGLTRATIYDRGEQRCFGLLHNKQWNLAGLPSNKAAVLVEALSFWDGTVKPNGNVEYYSSIEHNVDEVQAYLVRCGYRVSKYTYEYGTVDMKGEPHGLRYMLYIRPAKGYGNWDRDHVVQSAVCSESSYCVTVETGFILVRHNGNCCVLGNCQNPPKVKGLMDCIREPDPDNWVWVDQDFCALESVLLAYVTQDPGYLSIYGPGAKKNDLYIYFMAFIPGMDKAIKELGYDKDKPTKEALKAVKEKMKNERNTAKTAVLAMAYGCGKKTLHKNFILKGVMSNTMPGSLITEDETATIYNAFWKAFPGIKRYNEWNTECWERTGGYTISPIGLPIAAHPDRVRRLSNACIQSTGAIFTHAWLYYLEQEMDALGIEWYPVIFNFHDESLLRCRYTQHGKDETVRMAHEAMERALEHANALMCPVGDEIPMKISGDSGFNLTKFKIEEVI